MIRQIQDDDDSFHDTDKTHFKNAKGIALQELNNKTYLFTTGGGGEGVLQVYDFDNLIDGNDGNDTSALVSEIEDSNSNRLDESWDIKTFSEGGKAYALVTSQEAKNVSCGGSLRTSTFHQPLI